MDKRNYTILTIVVIALLAAVVVGIYTNTPPLWIAGIVLLIGSYFYTHSKKITVKNFLSNCIKFNGENKLEKTHYYLTDRFEKSIKYDAFKNFNPKGIKNLNIISNTDISTTFEVTFQSGKKYTLEVIKRNGKVDGKNIFSWVIDDISGHEFENISMEVDEDMIIN
ncbi:hypothetical protein [Dethiothermospora halolimnae]|uniref:hypothetical protein n=1 Tax=Dethiothermospora halolimnae TaxID=3114390 RepID=UPI003CCBD495